jgi:hypothetical protein
MTTWVHEAAEQMSITRRTLDQVRQGLETAKKTKADAALARCAMGA